MKRICWALVRVLFHFPYKVTSRNIRRCELNGDQQQKKAMTTTGKNGNFFKIK
jgi:hypothetical protein